MKNRGPCSRGSLSRRVSGRQTRARLKCGAPPPALLIPAKLLYQRLGLVFFFVSAYSARARSLSLSLSQREKRREGLFKGTAVNEEEEEEEEEEGFYWLPITSDRR